MYSKLYMKFFSQLDEFDRKFLIIIYPILIASVIILTIIHHVFPSVFAVPLRQGPYMFPSGMWIFELIFWDSLSIILSLILYAYTIKKHGFLLSTFFYTGSVIFTGLQECMWIYGGRFGLTYPTYYFTKAGLWFFDIPLYTCIGWFILAYCCVFTAEKLFSYKRVILTSFLGGFFAVSIDLWIDPMNVNLWRIALNKPPLPWFPNWGDFLNPIPGGNWVWLMRDTLKIFSIPFMNFLGWFLVVFLFAILWGKVRIKLENNEWDKAKCTKMFYLGIPLLLLICFAVLGATELLIIKPFLRNINIFPVGGA